MRQDIKVIKASGEAIPYESDKLIRSLERAGASEDIIDAILRQIEADLYEEIPSNKIYQQAFKLLRSYSKPLAAKYKLKRALMELGPSGYPFERFFGELLKFQGFEVKIGQIVQGHCVQHEVDVLASKEGRKVIVECKYHNRPGSKSDVKVPLYINSRFYDIRKAMRKKPENNSDKFEGWVVTNTHFTKDAIQYGICSGLRLIGWDFPQKGNINDFIDLSRLYPVTCLTTLTKKDKQLLLKQDVVLSNDLIDREDLLLDAGIKPGRIRNIMREVKELCEIC
ncbi:MAG: restriction endonuclease [Bacteroidota bacterium]